MRRYGTQRLGAHLDIPDSALDSFKKAVWRVIEGNPEALAPHLLSHANALKRIKARDLECRTVIDVGASDGCWSLMARQVWPEARFHLIEAFDHWKPDLERLRDGEPSFSFSLAAAGVEDGETVFTNSPDAPFGGTIRPEADDPQWTVPQVSIDREVGRLGLVGPFAIKLDTHGAEREILAGAAETLKQASLLVIEMYNFGDPTRRFPQMCQHVEALGFHCIDMAEPLFRDHDRAFWQVDFFFVPQDRPEARHTRW
ncbi:FkbM family methyltransferase [Azospirillum baldaniorum]|nr:FkbM family methyltransferase [Azospirillum baldaniorum]